MDETIKQMLDSTDENEIYAAISQYEDLASEAIEFAKEAMEFKIMLEKYAEENLL